MGTVGHLLSWGRVLASRARPCNHHVRQARRELNLVVTAVVDLLLSYLAIVDSIELLESVVLSRLDTEHPCVFIWSLLSVLAGDLMVRGEVHAWIPQLLVAKGFELLVLIREHLLLVNFDANFLLRLDVMQLIDQINKFIPSR